MNRTDNLMVALYGGLIAAVKWPLRLARNVRLWFTSDEKLIAAALDRYRRMSGRDFDLSGYDVQIVRDAWRIKVHFRRSVKYLPPDTSYVDDVVLDLSRDEASTGVVSNPPDADHDNVESYRETPEHERAVRHVLASLHARRPEQFPAGRLPFNDDAKLIVRDRGAAYEAEFISPNERTTYTIEKNGQAVEMAG